MHKWMMVGGLLGCLAVWAPADTPQVTVGYATGLISGNGFCLNVPAGDGRLQLVAGGFSLEASGLNSFSLGVDYKVPFARFSLGQDLSVWLYGVAGGSLFTGANVNWIGYGLLYSPGVTASLATYLLMAELGNTALVTEPNLVVGLGPGVDLGLLKVVHLTVEPVVAGMESLGSRGFRGLRVGVQSAVLFEL